MNSPKNRCDSAEGGVLAGDSVAKMMDSSQFGVSGKAADNQQTALDEGSNLKARAADDEATEQLSQIVTSRKTNAAKLKLPATCEAAKPKNNDFGSDVGNSQENHLKILQQDIVHIRDAQFRQHKSSIEPSNPALDIETRKSFAACVSKRWL